jgi:hypothetical protein
MDVRDRDQHSRDASLVPFRGETIGAEAEGDVVNGDLDPRIPPDRIERLVQDYEACFPRIRNFPIMASEACYKVEGRPGEGHGLECRIYDRANVSDWAEGVLFAVPGKASLAFTLADRVADRLAAVGFGCPME